MANFNDGEGMNFVSLAMDQDDCEVAALVEEILTAVVNDEANVHHVLEAGVDEASVENVVMLADGRLEPPMVQPMDITVSNAGGQAGSADEYLSVEEGELVIDPDRVSNASGVGGDVDLPVPPQEVTLSSGSESVQEIEGASEPKRLRYLGSGVLVEEEPGLVLTAEERKRRDAEDHARALAECDEQLSSDDDDGEFIDPDIAYPNPEEAAGVDRPIYRDLTRRGRGLGQGRGRYDGFRDISHVGVCFLCGVHGHLQGECTRKGRERDTDRVQNRRILPYAPPVRLSVEERRERGELPGPSTNRVSDPNNGASTSGQRPGPSGQPSTSAGYGYGAYGQARTGFWQCANVGSLKRSHSVTNQAGSTSTGGFDFRRLGAIPRRRPQSVRGANRGSESQEGRPPFASVYALDGGRTMQNVSGVRERNQPIGPRVVPLAAPRESDDDEAWHDPGHVETEQRQEHEEQERLGFEFAQSVNIRDSPDRVRVPRDQIAEVQAVNVLPNQYERAYEEEALVERRWNGELNPRVDDEGDAWNRVRNDELSPRDRRRIVDDAAEQRGAPPRQRLRPMPSVIYHMVSTSDVGFASLRSHRLFFTIFSVRIWWLGKQCLRLFDVWLTV